MDNDEEQTEQDEIDTYLRTSTEEEQKPSTWEEYDKEQPFEEYDEEESFKENDDEGKWMTQFFYPTEEEENTLFIAFMTGNVEDQKTWINAKMDLTRTVTNEKIRRREEEILDRIIPTGIMDLDRDFDEEETDNLSDCQTYDLAKDQERDLASIESDKFIDEHQEEEDVQPSKPLMTSYRDHKGQDEGTPHPQLSELDDQLIGAKYFTEQDVRWGYDDEHIRDKDKWEMTKTNQGLFEPLVKFSSPHPPMTSQTMIEEIFQDEQNKQRIIVNRDHNIQTKEED